VAVVVPSVAGAAEDSAAIVFIGSADARALEIADGEAVEAASRVTQMPKEAVGAEAVAVVETTMPGVTMVGVLMTGVRVAEAVDVAEVEMMVVAETIAAVEPQEVRAAAAAAVVRPLPSPCFCSFSGENGGGSLGLSLTPKAALTAEEAVPAAAAAAALFTFVARWKVRGTPFTDRPSSHLLGGRLLWVLTAECWPVCAEAKRAASTRSRYLLGNGPATCP
jgi:hypothetical protein